VQAVWHCDSGAQTDPPLLRGAQHPLLQSDPDEQAMAQIVPSAPPVLTQ
jgi:hypothetical protein